jgi:hypothetical protein
LACRGRPGIIPANPANGRTCTSVTGPIHIPVSLPSFQLPQAGVQTATGKHGHRGKKSQLANPYCSVVLTYSHCVVPPQQGKTKHQTDTCGKKEQGQEELSIHSLYPGFRTRFPISMGILAALRNLNHDWRDMPYPLDPESEAKAAPSGSSPNQSRSGSGQRIVLQSPH